MNRRMKAYFSMYAASDEFEWATSDASDKVPDDYTFATLDSDGRWWAYKLRPKYEVYSGAWHRKIHHPYSGIMFGWSPPTDHADRMLLEF